MNIKAFALGFALVLPFTAVSAADAAPKLRAGTVAVNVAASDFPILYPGAGNEDVRSVRFDITSTGMRSTDKVRLGLDCRDDAGAVAYSGTRTVFPANATLTAFTVSFYVSTRDTWTGQAATCDVSLFWESWNRKTLYSFGGDLDAIPAAFQIGA